MISLPAFLERHLQALEADQARHNLMLGLMDRIQKKPTEVRLWSFGDGARCAVQTPPKGIVLGDLTATDCEELALLVKDLDFRACTGNGEVPSRFAQALLPYGIELRLGMPQRIYTLAKPPQYPSTRGKGRAATLTDKPIYIDWTIRFCEEAVAHEPPPSREELEKVALDRPVFFWEVDGVPVAMASRSRETKNGSNISLVYTPSEFRGRGYGGSVTAFACENVFAENKKVASYLAPALKSRLSNIRLVGTYANSPPAAGDIFASRLPNQDPAAILTFLEKQETQAIVNLTRGETEADFLLHQKLIDFTNQHSLPYFYCSSFNACDAQLAHDHHESELPDAQSA